MEATIEPLAQNSALTTLVPNVFLMALILFIELDCKIASPVSIYNLNINTFVYIGNGNPLHFFFCTQYF